MQLPTASRSRKSPTLIGASVERAHRGHYRCWTRPRRFHLSDARICRRCGTQAPIRPVNQKPPETTPPTGGSWGSSSGSATISNVPPVLLTRHQTNSAPIRRLVRRSGRTTWPVNAASARPSSADPINPDGMNDCEVCQLSPVWEPRRPWDSRIPGRRVRTPRPGHRLRSGSPTRMTGGVRSIEQERISPRLIRHRLGWVGPAVKPAIETFGLAVDPVREQHRGPANGRRSADSHRLVHFQGSTESRARPRWDRPIGSRSRAALRVSRQSGMTCSTHSSNSASVLISRPIVEKCVATGEIRSERGNNISTVAHTSFRG